MDVNNEEDIITKITRLYNEGDKIRKDERFNNIWESTPIFDESMNDLRDLIEMTQYDSSILDVSLIEDRFDELEISKFGTFKAFATSKSVDASRYFNQPVNKVQINRATSKIDKCKRCNGPTIIESNKIVCQNPNCKYIEEIKIKRIQKTTNDKMKHLKDKLKTIAGLKTPPKKITTLFPHIKTWLTDLNYLNSWLLYKDKYIVMKNKLSYDEWCNGFNRLYHQNHNHKNSNWNDVMVIEDVAINAWNFMEYKMLIIEMYYMLSECERLNRVEFTTSNLDHKTDEEIYDIFLEYYKTKQTLPELREKFILNDEVYDIGNYINILRLLNVDSELKTKLEELFKTQISIPGLMYSFYLQPKNKPDRHVFTESYSYIIHLAFNISFDDVPLTLDVIETIATIIEEFDNYVREKQKSKHKNNSKLYVCKLKCILELPYFNKYSSIYKYFPVKSDETAGSIDVLWLEYTSKEPYKTKLAQYDVV